jgi:hypothetical protein
VKITTWMMTEDGCGAFRMKVGGNPNNIQDRVAFIEKTPRIRIRPGHSTEHMSPISDDGWSHYDYLNWAEAPFKGSGPESKESRDWCDSALVLFGYEL